MAGNYVTALLDGLLYGKTCLRQPFGQGNKGPDVETWGKGGQSQCAQASMLGQLRRASLAAPCVFDAAGTHSAAYRTHN